MASEEKRILLVEDEKTIRDAVAAYLEREGYMVRGVGDGQSALEEFEKHSFDLNQAVLSARARCPRTRPAAPCAYGKRARP